MTPSRDDFARWLDDSVTRYVMRALTGMADANKAEWDRISWGNGAANQRVLDELRTRADAYRAISETTYAGFCEANGDEPNEE